MCQARFDNGAFDPAFCPLLAGLSPEEIAVRLANDPMIRRCAGMESAPEPCEASSLRPGKPASAAKHAASLETGLFAAE